MLWDGASLGDGWRADPRAGVNASAAVCSPHDVQISSAKHVTWDWVAGKENLIICQGVFPTACSGW